MKPRRGFTILELSLVSTLMAVVMLVSTLLLFYGMRTWRQLDSSQDASFQLARSCRRLREELRQTSFNQCKVTNQSNALGDIVTFLSAVDEPSGEVLFAPDGSPFWQRNLLFYLAIPPGDGCRPPARCIHKRLLRLALDTEDPTGPDTDPAVSEEALLDDPLSKLSSEAPAVANNLTSFQVQLAPTPASFPDEVKVTVGAESNGKVQTTQFSVFPRNLQ